MSTTQCGSNFSVSTLLLSGFTGLEQSYVWIAIPFSCIYVIVLLGNCMMLHVIRTEQSLHVPMFYFLAMLSFTDLCLALTTVHTVLGIRWEFKSDITLDACLGQCFFIHSLSFTESSVLLAMSFDRYIAICNPLRYSSILTNARIIKIGITIIIRSFLFTTPIICLKFFNYCRPHLLSRSFCLHQDLLCLSCSDIHFNGYYGLGLVICTLMIDSILILVSYVLILKSVLAIASPNKRLKCFQTCVSHICAVLVFYIPIISLTMVHRFGKHLSPIVHVLMGNIYILFPPLMNPIIYSVKTQQIRNRIQRLFLGQRY
ncbi:olfactory receptor 51V1-like [Macrotis lagotis]|uniref:olfactory receptor 51V1-like n=1 Tax=Macrotis lagotis TaxID=92651 RepID=UPI003D693061